MNFNVVVLKSGELVLKSKRVRNIMEKKLLQNVRACLGHYDIISIVSKGQLRYLVYTKDCDKAIKVLKNVFGISKLNKAVEIDLDLKEINKTALEFLNGSKSKKFYVSVKRANKKFPKTSTEIGSDVSKFLTENTKKIGDYKAKHVIYIDILENKALVYDEVISGYSGLPVGVSGKVFCLMSLKEKDFVAAWLMLRKGCDVEYSHYVKNAKDVPKEEKKFASKLEFLKKVSYGIKCEYNLLSGKNMFDLAQEFAKKLKAKSIIIGETDLKEFLKLKKRQIPVYAPLIGMNKREIEKIKKAIFNK